MQKIIDIIDDKLLFVDDVTSECYYLFYTYNFQTEDTTLLLKFPKDNKEIIIGDIVFLTDENNKFIYLNENLIFFIENKLIVFNTKQKRSSSKKFSTFIYKIKKVNNILAIFFIDKTIALYNQNLELIFEYHKKIEKNNHLITHYDINDVTVLENFVYLLVENKEFNLDEDFSPKIKYFLYRINILNKEIVSMFQCLSKLEKILTYKNYIFLPSNDKTFILNEKLIQVKVVDLRIKHLEKHENELYVLSTKFHHQKINSYFGKFDINNFQYINYQTIKNNISLFKLHKHTIIFEKKEEIIIKNNDKIFLLSPPFKQPFIIYILCRIKKVLLNVNKLFFSPKPLP